MREQWIVGSKSLSHIPRTSSATAMDCKSSHVPLPQTGTDLPINPKIGHHGTKRGGPESSSRAHSKNVSPNRKADEDRAAQVRALFAEALCRSKGSVATRRGEGFAVVASAH